MSKKSRPGFDPLQVEVFQHLFAAVAEEMGACLQRSAFSPNIVERRDYSCALFDAQARMVGQAAHLPVHLGAAPRSVAAVLERCELAPGDAVLLNDPYLGGTHLPDLTLVSPVFLESGPGARPAFFVCNRAHHADVGGPYPGSMGPARDVHAEGLRLPPIHLVRGGVLDPAVLELFLANVRGRDERRGDLLAQWAACRLGVERLQALADDHGAAELVQRANDQIEWTAGLARACVAQWPRGRYAVEAELDFVADAEPDAERPRLKLELRVERGRAVFDFSASADQLPLPVNAPTAVVEAAVFYGLRLLLPEGTPTNHGCLAPIEVRTRPGSVLDPRYPAAVAGGNVETSQRLVDLCLAALACVEPERLPADSAGTMSNLSFGGVVASGLPFAFYETHGGGAGGRPDGPGAHALQTHMTNTRNTPVEALERQLPVELLAYGVRRESGGAGRHPGGDGQQKRLRFRRPVELSFLAGRQHSGPGGRAGGGDGRPGRLRVRVAGGRWTRWAGVGSGPLPEGSEVELLTPGGGGFGAP
ncbi:MAG: hydantoinase B/oxoprolinase family protein [Planctomycetota bacterium]|jgi:N-methylhydantoinase B